jgi:Tfp pilus assembly protein PilO
MNKGKYSPQVFELVSRYAKLIILGIPLVFCAAGYLFVVAPFNAKEQEVKNKISVLIENQKKFQELEFEKSGVARLENHFIDKNDLSRFLEELLRTAQTFNLDIASIQPQHEEVFQDRPSSVFSIVAHGKYPDIENFIRALSASQKILIIEELSISGLEAQNIVDEFERFYERPLMARSAMVAAPELSRDKYDEGVVLEFRLRARIFLKE